VKGKGGREEKNVGRALYAALASSKGGGGTALPIGLWGGGGA